MHPTHVRSDAASLTDFWPEGYPETVVSDELEHSERELLILLRRGDPHAFEILVHGHQHRVFGLCLRMLGDADEAADLAQDVFLTVFRHIGDFRGESHLGTWIYRIARNLCLNRIKFLKRRGSERRMPLQSAREEELPDQPGRVSGCIERPDRLAEGQELQAHIERAISALCAEHRELILLCDVEHLSYEEIQEVTGLAEGTVKSRLHRARMELARRLAPYLEGE